MAVAETLEIVSFSAGACRFAVDAQQIEAVLHDLPEAMVALEAWLGLPVVETARRRCLRVGEYSVGVCEPLDLRALPLDRIHPLPEFVARRMTIKGVCALALDADGAVLLLDFRALLTPHPTITPA